MAMAFVAMMIPDGSNQFFSRLAQLVQRELSVLANTGMVLLDADSSPKTELDYITWVGDQWRRKAICAAVYIPTGDNVANFFRLFALGLPVVVLDREIPEDFAKTPIDMVLADNVAGMHLVAEHLIEIGVQRPAYIGGSVGTEPGRMRNAAFADSWKDLGGGPMPASFNGDFSFESGKSAGEAIPHLANRPDAVVAANDMMALGALQALQREGIAVPDDIVLTGYDDVAMANWVYPALTTVRQDVEAMARQAAGYVIRRVSGEGGPGGMRTPIEPELVVRESTTR